MNMIIIFFLCGLIIGSFLNVVINRLSAVESLLTRSRCNDCKNTIAWYDNIPLVSFALLRGSCRSCTSKISWQYPIVELSTGFLYAYICFLFFSLENPSTWPVTMFFIILFSLLLVIFVYDVKYLEIPMLVLWTGVALTFIYLFYWDFTHFDSSTSYMSLLLISGICGGLAAFSFFFIFAYASSEKWMGMGDAYIGLLIGFVVGFPNVFIVLLLSFILGGIVSVFLLLSSQKGLKSHVPFAPFLIFGLLMYLSITVFMPDFFALYFFGYYFS